MHYLTDGKPYFAVGFPNRSGGYEIRNKFFKGLHSPERHHPHTANGTGETCCLFEGFMDYLSFLTLRQERHPDRPAFDGQDCIVLNSVSTFPKPCGRWGIMSGYTASLTTTAPGWKPCAKSKEYGLRVRDASHVYSGYKDLNDYLNGKKLSQQANPVRQAKQVQWVQQPGKKKGKASECNRTHPAGFLHSESHSSIGRFLHAAQAQLKTPY